MKWLLLKIPQPEAAGPLRPCWLFTSEEAAMPTAVAMAGTIQCVVIVVGPLRRQRQRIRQS